jgi:hypothetical protein
VFGLPFSLVTAVTMFFCLFHHDEEKGTALLLSLSTAVKEKKGFHSAL